MSHEDERGTTLEPQLAASLRALSEDGLEPERDLWPELESRIGTVPSARRPVWHYAAAAMVVVGAAAGLFWMLSGPRYATGFESLAASRSQAQVPQASSAEFRKTFRDYLDERERILGLVAEQLRNYPPEVRNEIRHSIEVIEQAMRDIEASVATVTPDPETEARLAELYDLELRLVGVVNDRLSESAGGV